MKRLFLPILLLALAMPVAAQEKPPQEDTGPILNGARQLVIEFLDLDADQAAAWEVLWADHRAAEVPILDQIADVQAIIEDLFAAGVPDATELGLLVIERHDLGDALIDVHRVYLEGFELLLDEDQGRRLRELRVAERIQGFIPAFRALDLVRR